MWIWVVLKPIFFFFLKIIYRLKGSTLRLIFVFGNRDSCIVGLMQQTLIEEVYYGLFHKYSPILLYHISLLQSKSFSVEVKPPIFIGSCDTTVAIKVLCVEFLLG